MLLGLPDMLPDFPSARQSSLREDKGETRWGVVIRPGVKLWMRLQEAGVPGVQCEY
jgi:hypothetical protein